MLKTVDQSAQRNDLRRMRHPALAPAIHGSFLAIVIGVAAGAQTVPSCIEDQREMSYRSGGGPEWRLDFAEPKSHDKPLPAIVVIHGGGWIEGDKSSYDQLIVDWAGLGFCAITLNYRLANETKASFPQAIEDCKCAVRWLRAHAGTLHVDKDRIGVYGSSAGGHLALMLGILSKNAGDSYEGDGPYQEESSDVCAVASDSGIVTLNMNLPGNKTLARDFVEFLGASPPPDPAVKKASPASYVDRAPHLPPMLLIYGTADTQVPIALTDDFVAALRAHKHPDLIYTRYDGVDHCPFFSQHAPGAREEVEKFLIRTVKNRETK